MYDFAHTDPAIPARPAGDRCACSCCTCPGSSRPHHPAAARGRRENLERSAGRDTGARPGVPAGIPGPPSTVRRSQALRIFFTPKLFSRMDLVLKRMLDESKRKRNFGICGRAAGAGVKNKKTVGCPQVPSEARARLLRVKPERMGYRGNSAGVTQREKAGS